ncbi:hypothetical protein ASF58_09755 [Methylobacterium sp. Leaf125]|nr:hypothetical protein ASF58_09755 [Methylobacterium sp. Leaf125]
MLIRCIIMGPNGLKPTCQAAFFDGSEDRIEPGIDLCQRNRATSPDAVEEAVQNFLGARYVLKHRL